MHTNLLVVLYEIETYEKKRKFSCSKQEMHTVFWWETFWKATEKVYKRITLRCVQKRYIVRMGSRWN
jgi:hypothetical protein